MERERIWTFVVKNRFKMRWEAKDTRQSIVYIFYILSNDNDGYKALTIILIMTEMTSGTNAMVM